MFVGGDGGLGGKFSEFCLFLYILGISIFYLLFAIKQSFRDCLSNLKVTIISNTDGFFPQFIYIPAQAL